MWTVSLKMRAGLPCKCFGRTPHVKFCACCLCACVNHWTTGHSVTCRHSLCMWLHRAIAFDMQLIRSMQPRRKEQRARESPGSLGVSGVSRCIDNRPTKLEGIRWFWSVLQSTGGSLHSAQLRCRTSASRQGATEPLPLRQLHYSKGLGPGCEEQGNAQKTLSRGAIGLRHDSLTTKVIRLIIS